MSTGPPTIARLAIVESTLREGEQFAGSHFSTAQKLRIAGMLDAFGVEYIEVTSPVASVQTEADARAIAAMPRRARVVAHTRCDLDDCRRALDTGVDGVHVLFGTSDLLRRHSHRRSLDEIIARATEVIAYVRDRGCEIRFSAEDAFRSDPADLLRVYRAVDALGPDRIGLADTVGIATPDQVGDLVGMVRREVAADIEFHAHNDAGCAVANAFAALEAGATHIDTTVLGIGERNGIVPLSGLVARLLTVQPALLAPYRLELLPELDAMVAEIVGVPIPFNAAITSATAFHHKAGIHTRAVISNPSSYEILDPARFGLERTVAVGHRLSGRAAVGDRARALGLAFDEDQLREVTTAVKDRADRKPMTVTEVDELLQLWASSGGCHGNPG